jgi:hypothetical protein
MLIEKKNFMALLHIEYKIPMLQILNQRSREHKKLAELYADVGVDAMENSFYPIEFRVKEEIGKDASHIVHGAMT